MNGGLFLDTRTDDQLLFKSSNESPSRTGARSSPKQRHQPIYRSSVPQGQILISSLSSGRARQPPVGDGGVVKQSVVPHKELRSPSSRPTNSQSPTSIPRRVAPSVPHPKSGSPANTISMDGQKRHGLYQPHPASRLSPIPIQYSQVSMAMNHWQELLEGDRNFESLPPSVLQKMHTRDGASRHVSPEGRPERGQHSSSRIMSMDMQVDADDSSAMNLTFCGGAPTTVLTEEPSCVVSRRSIEQYTVEEQHLSSSDTESRARCVPDECDRRRVREEAVGASQLHGTQPRLIVEEEEDYPLFQSKQVVSPTSLHPAKVMYNLPPRMISNRGGGESTKAAVSYSHGARTSNLRPNFRGSRAPTQTVQTAPWDRYLSFSSDETAILAETRRILFEGIRIHSRIAAEYDCTTPIREKALDDLKKSLGVIQALPPIDSSAFVVGQVVSPS